MSSKELNEPISVQMREGSETARLLSGEYAPLPSEDGVKGHVGTSSNFSAVLNICNTVLGSGVLGMATAINR